MARCACGGEFSEPENEKDFGPVSSHQRTCRDCGNVVDVVIEQLSQPDGEGRTQWRISINERDLL